MATHRNIMQITVVAARVQLKAIIILEARDRLLIFVFFITDKESGSLETSFIVGDCLYLITKTWLIGWIRSLAFGGKVEKD